MADDVSVSEPPDVVQESVEVVAVTEDVIESFFPPIRFPLRSPAS